MKKIILHITLISLIMVLPFIVFGQESVFTGLQAKAKKAEMYYQNRAYHKAIELYERLIPNNQGDLELLLKLANAYYFSNEMGMAITSYQKYAQKSGHVDDEVMLRYAHALQAKGEYKRAIAWLEQYNVSNPDDFEVSKKIWQLKNINFLYEDSLYYQVSPVSINSSFDEIAPVIHGNALIFCSNKPSTKVIQRIEGSSGKPYFDWQLTERVPIKKNSDLEVNYTSSNLFAPELHSKFHKGSLSFTPSGDTMVFARSSYQSNASDEYATQLFFATKVADKWVEYAGFPFNSLQYSINHPVYSNDGKSIYFSSDMPGGFGGKDLYRSKYVNGKWTAPENLGKEINTSRDEGHPFVLHNILYFSSNGHPGLGGLDIFKVNLSSVPSEIINFGYPINTPFDDFDMVLDSTSAYGYLVSNRKIDNDDIYEVKLKKLTFPIVIQGVIKYVANGLNYSDSDMNILTNATLELIENSTDRVVQKTITDDQGNFSIEIPYESQFLLKVKQETFGDAIVSMEIPDNHWDYLNHDIVIVKE